MQGPELRYCPRCAGELHHRPMGDTARPALHPTCVRCGFVLWQNPKPTVEGLIVRGSGVDTEVLLGHRAAGDGWDIPGNFLNIGAGIAETLVAECRRETGLEVAVGDIVGAFEDTFAGGEIICIVYVCEAVGGAPVPAPPVDDLSWFPLASPPKMAYSAARRAIEALQRRLGIAS